MAGRRGRSVMSGRSIRRLSAVATVGSAGHNWFERWAGVGVFLEPWLGRRATNILWAVQPAWALWRAFAGRDRDEPWLAFNAGTAVAAASTHFVDWPWSRRFGFLPWLEEVEGLPPRLVPAYNTVLWVWLLSGAGSIITETRRENIKYAAAGLAMFPILLASARHHFAWAREQARREQAETGASRRWNPALLDASPSARVRSTQQQPEAQ